MTAPDDPCALLTVGEAEAQNSVLIRQRILEVDLPSGGPAGDHSVSLLSRFNPVLGSASAIATALSSREAPTRFRATVVPTELGPSHRHGLDEQIRAVARARRHLDEHPELSWMIDRVDTTLQDLRASAASPLLVAELALTSETPLPETFCRVVGAAHTSESDVLRRGAWTTVAGQRLILGGFDVEAAPADHVSALRLGLPAYGYLLPTTLRDLVSLSECPLAWPVPVNGAVPGVPREESPPRLRTDALAPKFDEPVLAHDPAGAPIAIPWSRRTTHVFISGVTGSGKTTLLDAMVRADVTSARPFFVVDFHGQWHRRLLGICADAGLRPVVLDVADGDTARLEMTPALQVVEGAVVNREQVAAAARRLCDAFTSHLNPEWSGPVWHSRAVAVLELAAAYRVELATVLGWVLDPDALDDAVEHPHLSSISRGVLASMARQRSGDGLHGLEWTQSKWTALAAGPARRLLAVPGAGVDLAAALLCGTPVLVNLSALSPADASVFAHITLHDVLEGIFSAGPDPKRQIAGYVDEAHRALPHNLERAWAESRKFGLALTVASQSVLQFPTVAADLALSSGTVIAFRQAPAASRILGEVLGIDSPELTTLPDLDAIIRLAGSGACGARVSPYPPAPAPSSPAPPQPLPEADLAPGFRLLEQLTAPETAY
ncbi:MAG: ATP-binding protein [Frankiales bacterium]|nr:ATP-binding protein [Frankiales bacterium]